MEIIRKWIPLTHTPKKPILKIAEEKGIEGTTVSGGRKIHIGSHLNNVFYPSFLWPQKHTWDPAGQYL